MIILFQNVLFSKEFHTYIGSFRLFTKIKKESGTSFSAPFWVHFLWKYSLFITVSNDCLGVSNFQYETKFSSHDTKFFFFFFFFSSCLANWWCHKLYNLTLIIFFKQWLTGKKRGRGKYESLNIWRRTKKVF